MAFFDSALQWGIGASLACSATVLVCSIVFSFTRGKRQSALVFVPVTGPPPLYLVKGGKPQAAIPGRNGQATQLWLVSGESF